MCNYTLLELIGTLARSGFAGARSFENIDLFEIYEMCHSAKDLPVGSSSGGKSVERNEFMRNNNLSHNIPKIISFLNGCH